MTQALKAQGYRITPQRLAVLKILADGQKHPSVEQIYQQVKKEFPTTSLATIYKTISVLKSLGEVLELGFADSSSRYDGAKPYPHIHVICTECGKIVDPDKWPLADISDQVAGDTGYRITHHRVDFYGLCPDCRKGRG